MINDVKDLIYSHDQQNQKLESIKKLLENFNAVNGKSHLHYSKLVQTLNEIMELEK